MSKVEMMRAKEQKKGALVPRLRFPEFRDAGEWEEIKLNNICDVLPGYGFPETLQGKQSGQYPFCKVSDISKAISDNGGLLKASVNYINDTELFLLKAKLIPAGSTVFAKIGEALRLNRRAISAVECLIDNNAVGIKAKDKKSTDYFLYILSQRINLNEYCGGAVPSVNKTTLENIDVLIPSIPEQQKIADCLSSLDERITAESNKLDTLKDHKKGLLKQLFPAEGENLPQLRFPEFRDAGEWEEKIISDVCSISTGKSNTEDKNDDGNFPFYVRSPIIERSTKYLYDEEAILTVGDGVGTGKVYHYVKGKYDLHQRVYRLFRFLNIDGKFLFYLFSTFFYYRVSKMSAKNSVDSVRMDMIAKMPIFVPTLAEQQRITDCLSSIDELITAQTQKIDLLKEHKKGLMQQLFPVIDEAKA